MSREFKYTQKETYSQSELDEILGQHSKFVEGGYKGYVSEDEHKKLIDELKPFKAEKRFNHISDIVKDLTDSNEKTKDAIALANISEDDDDETIKTKVSKVIEEREYLQKQKAGIPPEINKTKKVDEKPQQEVENKYSNV